MKVYLVTEKSDIFDDIQLIFDSYDCAKAYVHDELVKIKHFVEEHPVPLEIEPDYEELHTRFEEPLLGTKYVGTLYVKNKYWELDTPIAKIDISQRDVMSFSDGTLKAAPANDVRIRPFTSYASYHNKEVE